MKVLMNMNPFRPNRVQIKTIAELDSIIVGKKLSEMDLKDGQEITIRFAFAGVDFKSVWTVIDTEAETFREGLVMKIDLGE